MNSNIVAYTTIFGDRDSLESLEWPYRTVPCVCFTDIQGVHLKNNIEVRTVDPLFKDSTLTARWYKWHPHVLFPFFKYSIWFDANIRFKINFHPEVAIEQYLEVQDSLMALYSHPHRDCVYEELDICIRDKRASLLKMYLQKQAYKKAGLPVHSGLRDTGIMYRRHNVVETISNSCWRELKIHAKRDQPALGYIEWLMGLDPLIYTIPENSWNNDYFYRVGHKQ